MMVCSLGASALGIALASPIMGHWAYTLALLLCSLLLCWNQRPQWLMSLALLWLILIGFAGWSLWRVPQPTALDLAQVAPCFRCEIEGQLSSTPMRKGQDRLRFVLAVTRLNGQPAEGKTLVTLSKIQAMHYGQTLRLTGRIQAPNTDQNFGEFSYRDYLARQGIFSVFKAKQVEVVAEAKVWNMLAALHRLKGDIHWHFNQALNVGESALLSSLVFGSQAAPIPQEIEDTFQKVGLQHVLAVSGFQVNLLVVTLLLICQICHLPRWIGFGLSLTLLWLFIALTGFPPSVLRAGMVASLGLMAFLCFQQVHTLQALLAGSWLLLLWQPLLLWDIGFQFSFLATLGLILASERFENWLHFLPLILSKSLGAILAAQLFVLPVQLYHFGQFSLLFLPANLVAGLFVPLLTWVALGALPILALWPPLFYALGPIVHWIISAFLLAITGLSYGEHTLIQWPQFSGMMVAMTFMVIGALLWKRRRPWMPYLLLGSLLSLPLLAWGQTYQDNQRCPVRVTYFSIGQGDAALIEAGGKTILIDAGPAYEYKGKTYDAGQRYILPYLERQGIKQIDLAVISHAHRDHYGGFESLLEQIPIQTFWGVSFDGESEAYLQLLQQIQALGIPFQILWQPQEQILDQGLILKGFPPMSPEAHDHAGVNNASLVLTLQHRQLRFLWTGDIEEDAESYWVAQAGEALQAQILKVPHHGSKTSSTSKFIAQVQPLEAIISVGENNRYRHPSPEVVERYWQQGVRVWRTDQQGAVCVCSQGETYSVYSLN